jgi:hypothetical protein
MSDDPVKCVFCGLEATEGTPANQPQVHYLECPRCREYSITDEAIWEMEAHPLTDRKKANASGWIREQRTRPVIQYDQVDYFKKRLRNPAVGERAEKIMRYFAEVFPDLDMMEMVDMNDPVLAGVSWSTKPEEVRYLISEYLGEALQFLRSTHYAGPTIRVTILPRGWEYIESLQASNPNSPIGFIAMFFDPSLYALRDRALIPAIQGAGYREFVVNLYPTNQDLMDEVLAGIRRSKFVIADFSGNRHNVYFEAGFAQGLGIPVIHTCKEDEVKQVTFDVWS